MEKPPLATGFYNLRPNPPLFLKSLAHFKIHWRFSKSVVVLIYFGYTVTGPNSLNTKTIYPIENYCEEL
jgi:hypothetical protein